MSIRVERLNTVFAEKLMLVKFISLRSRFSTETSGRLHSSERENSQLVDFFQINVTDHSRGSFKVFAPKLL